MSPGYWSKEQGTLSGKRIPRYRRWSLSAVECYLRGCICGPIDGDPEECPNRYICSRESAEYVMKDVVLYLVRVKGTNFLEMDFTAREKHYIIMRKRKYIKD